MDLYAQKVICQIMDLRSDLLDAASQYHDYRESSTTNSEHLAFDIVDQENTSKIIENIASDRNRDYIVIRDPLVQGEGPIVTWDQ